MTMLVYQRVMTNAFYFLCSWFVGRNNAVKTSSRVRFLFANLHHFTIYFGLNDLHGSLMVDVWCLTCFEMVAFSNHGSVESGCVWRVTNIGDVPIFHWTITMGGRVACEKRWATFRWATFRLSQRVTWQIFFLKLLQGWLVRCCCWFDNGH